HPVAEAHEQSVTRFGLFNCLRHTLDRADLAQHANHGFVSPAVQWARQCAHSGGDGHVRVGMRRSDGAHRAGAGILLVVGVQDEQYFEGALEHRDRKSTRLNSSHVKISYAVFCLKKKKKKNHKEKNEKTNTLI